MSEKRDVTALPLSCADVTFDMGDGSYEDDLGWWEGGGIGSLIWNPKGGDGHVLTETRTCGEPLGIGRHPGASADCGCNGYVNGCKATVTLCECGEDDSWRDHHYRLLRRAS